MVIEYTVQRVERCGEMLLVEKKRDRNLLVDYKEVDIVFWQNFDNGIVSDAF